MQREARATALTDFQNGLGVSLCSLKKLAEQRSERRRIRVYLHGELGKVFVIGSEIQHVEAWAPLYHEPLVHLPACFVRSVRNVLILGGGTLFAAAEALKYHSVKEVVLIDHDPGIIKMAQRFYPHARACLRDPRMTVKYSDAYSTLLSMDGHFDLVINDGIDLLNLCTESTARLGIGRLLMKMRNLVAPSGICADVVYRHVFERRRIMRTLKLLRGAPMAFALVFLPEYHGVLHLLTMWGNAESSLAQTPSKPKNDEQRHWANSIGACPCVYYDPRYLQYYLYLPKFLRDLLQE